MNGLKMYAQKIKQIRSELNLSVAKLAQKINIPQRTVSAYERNERTPSIEFLAQMCIVLNINANWFLANKGEMFNPPVSDICQFKDELLSEVRAMLIQEGVIK